MTLHHPPESTQDPTRRRALAGAISVLALTLLPGCGNLTAGGFGEARVVANGDAPDTTSPTAAVLAAAPASHCPHQQRSALGTPNRFP